MSINTDIEDWNKEYIPQEPEDLTLISETMVGEQTQEEHVLLAANSSDPLPPTDIWTKYSLSPSGADDVKVIFTINDTVILSFTCPKNIAAAIMCAEKSYAIGNNSAVRDGWVFNEASQQVFPPEENNRPKISFTFSETGKATYQFVNE